MERAHSSGVGRVVRGGQRRVRAAECGELLPSYSVGLESWRLWGGLAPGILDPSAGGNAVAYSREMHGGRLVPLVRLLQKLVRRRRVPLIFFLLFFLAIARSGKFCDLTLGLARELIRQATLAA